MSCEHLNIYVGVNQGMLLYRSYCWDCRRSIRSTELPIYWRLAAAFEEIP